MEKKEVYEALRFKIITNTIESSTIWNEKALMEEYEVGRSPLREVLFKLQEEELLKPLPRLGYMISPLDISEVRELVELRIELEGFAGALAAERINPSQLEHLKMIIKKGTDEIPDDQSIQDISEYSDSQFHHIIYEATGNRKLIKTLRELHLVMLRIWFYVGFKTIGFSKQEKNLQEVMESLENNEPAKARKAMEAHVELFASRVREKFL